MRSCAVVTPLSFDASFKRAPLRNLLLPSSLARCWEEIGAERVWWIESWRTRRFVRAVFDVASRLPVAQQQGTQELLSLQARFSERITWPHGRTKFAASAKIALPAFAARLLSPEEESELERIRQSACPMGSESGAKRVISRLLKDTLFERAPIDACIPNFEYALGYALENFARAELVSIDGRNPFEVAAQILMPEVRYEPTVRTGAIRHMPTLCAFDSSSLSSSSLTCAIMAQDTMQKLRTSTRRHHSIVEALAANLSECGFRPQHNSFVDLAVVSQESQMLFEVKTSGPYNLHKQLRQAVGQLFEYRYLMASTASRRVKLAVVIGSYECPFDEQYAKGFLESVGVSLVIWRPSSHTFDGLHDVLCEYAEASS